MNLSVAFFGQPAVAKVAQEITSQELADNPPLRRQAVAVLHDALNQEPLWVKVHAAEYLLALDYRSEVREIFEQEQVAHSDEPKYRIGIWRVLARESYDVARRDRFISRIRATFLDSSGPDRVHAVETLAKLYYQAGTAVLDPQGETAANLTPERREQMQRAELDTFADAARGRFRFAAVRELGPFKLCRRSGRTPHGGRAIGRTACR